MPAIYVIITATIAVILLIYKPDYTIPGMGLVLLGIPVYYFWKKYNKGQPEAIGEDIDQEL